NRRLRRCPRCRGRLPPRRSTRRLDRIPATNPKGVSAVPAYVSERKTFARAKRRRRRERFTFFISIGVIAVAVATTVDVAHNRTSPFDFTLQSSTAPPANTSDPSDSPP